MFPSPVRTTLLAFVVIATLLTAPPCAACPFCHGDPIGGNPVRREVFGAYFARHLFATAAPFTVLAVVAGLCYVLPTGRKGKR